MRKTGIGVYGWNELKVNQCGYIRAIKVYKHTSIGAAFSAPLQVVGVGAKQGKPALERMVGMSSKVYKHIGIGATYNAPLQVVRVWRL